MNKKKLIDKILENWPAKILCMVIAIFIYIFHQVTLLEKKTMTVPLNVESNGVLMPVSDVPRFVKVTVRSTQEIIPTIYSSGIKASVNMDNITKPGTYDIPVNLTLSEGLSLTDPLEIHVKPEVLHISLDEKIMKYLPVEPAISGKPEHGYTVKDITVSPSTVKVVGPSTILNKTKFIYTKKVVLTGAAKSFSNDIKLDNVVSALQVFPEGDFKVSVSVVPADFEKSFENIPVKIMNLSENLVLDTEIQPLSFTLAGTMPVLEKFVFNEDDVFADFSQITEPGTYEISVTIKTPASVAFIEKPLTVFSISVSQKPEPQEEPVEVLEIPEVPVIEEVPPAQPEVPVIEEQKE